MTPAASTPMISAKVRPMTEVVEAEGVRVELVREQAAEGAGLEVGDEHRHVVGQQLELVGPARAVSSARRVVVTSFTAHR